MFGRTPSIRIVAKGDISKKSSDSSGNNNRGSQGTPNSDSNHSNTPGTDPLHEFETEHIPDVPKEDHGHSTPDLDHPDAKVENHLGDAVTEIGATTQNLTEPSTGPSSTLLTYVFILLIIALFIIPIAVVIQSNKEALKGTATYKSFDNFLYRITGIHPL